MQNSIKLVRITTAPISLKMLITQQPHYMQQAGFEVTLISAEGPEWKEIPSINTFTTKKIPLARQIALIQDIKALWLLYLYFRKIKPTIVHSHTPKAGLLGMMAAAFAGVPVRIHTLAGLPLITTTGVRRKILTYAEQLTYFFAQQVWVNSKNLKDFVVGNNLLPTTKAIMILNGSSNGIDLTKYATEKLDKARIEAIKKAYAFSEEQFNFLAVGRAVKDKGIIELVDAFINVHKKNPSTRLFILGPFEQSLDPLPDSYISLIQSHSNIVHISWSNEVEYFMHLCQCFVHASHREGFPNVILQAAAMGCPIICSIISGNIDIVENESEGQLFQVKQMQQLVEKMNFVLSNYANAKAKAIVLKEKIITNYDRKAVHAAIKKAYLQLLIVKNINVSSIH